jgi:hypothetical protein
MSDLVDAIVTVTAIVCLASLAVLAGVLVAVVAPDHRHPVGRRWVTWYERHAGGDG